MLLLSVASLFGRNMYRVEGNSVIVDLEGIGVKSRILKVEVWSESAVKVTAGMDVNLSTFQSLIPSVQPQPIKFKVAYAQNNIEITTKKVIVSIQEDGLVSILNRNGNKLILESDRFLSPSNEKEAKYKIKQRYFLNMHESIFGFGYEEGSSRYSLRDQSFTQTQSATGIACPVFFSEKGYALIWDNYSSTFFNDKKGSLEISSDLADEVQYFLIYGPTWDEIVTEIRTLTGNVPMLPRWAFGYWCFPENYSNSNEFNAAIQKYNEEGIPVETGTTPDYSLFQEEKSYLANSEAANSRTSCVTAYSKLKNKYSDLQKLTLDRRLCIPTLSDYPGVQKFGTFLIAGEIKPSWENLKGQVSAAINLSLSGQPYISTNIGGVSSPDAAFNTYDELLARWYQFAAFTPVFRAPKPDRDLTYLKTKSSTCYDAAKKAIILRYHLMPYLYTTAYDVATKNATYARSLLFEYQKDEKVHTIDQQYLFGNSMMICPVSSPDAKQVPVYFPGESGWVDFWNGKQYAGQTTQNIDVTLDHIPVFVKSGSIIPFATIGSSSIDSLTAPVELRIYPGRDASFTLYEDSNDGFGYQTGQCAKIVIDYSEKDKTVSIGSIEGSYSGLTLERVFNVVLVTDSNGIGSDMSAKSQQVLYKGKKIKIKVE